MSDIDKNRVLEYLERKRKAYQNRINICISKNDTLSIHTYEIRLKPITDLIIYLHKIDSLDKIKFVKRIEEKRNQLRKSRDDYESRNEKLSATDCEISILPLENLIRHIMVGNLDLQLQPVIKQTDINLPLMNDDSKKE
jgi:hypothetical protein